MKFQNDRKHFLKKYPMIIFDENLMKNIVIFYIFQKSMEISKISIGVPIINVWISGKFQKIFSKIFSDHFEISNRFEIF